MGRSLQRERRRGRRALVLAVECAIIVLGIVGSHAADRRQTRNDRKVTFANDIAPIIFERCIKCHHPGGSAPFSLVSYLDVRRHATQIAAATMSRFMPPWRTEPGSGDFIGQEALTDTQVELIQRWVNEGTVEGDPRDVPTPLWSDGWHLGTPDLILTPSDRYTLSPEGPDVFRVFVLPIQVGVARYVTGVEFRPTNTRAVHHANILLDSTPTSRMLNEQTPQSGEQGLLARTARYPQGHFLGWTPGEPDPLLPPDMSWRLEPGTDLVVQLHLQPTGRPELIQFSVGFFFGDRPPERIPTLLRLGRQSIDIAAGTRDYSIADTYVLPVDVELLALKPHAHYRAREVRGYAQLPDGTRKSLLHITDWNFRWQHVYRYVVPLALPKGTRLITEFRYDNSAENPQNPVRPPRRARWGPSSVDEMGDFWMQVLTGTDADRASLESDFARKATEEDAVGYEALVERDPGNTHIREQLGGVYLEIGKPQQAVAHLEASVLENTGSARAHFNLGTALMGAGRTSDAIREYLEALRLQPDFGAAHYNLGNALDEAGRSDDALEHYRQASRLQPQNAAAHNNAGFILMKQGQFVEAVREFQQTLGLDPTFQDAHYNLAVALLNRGDTLDAIGHFRRALDLNPHRAAATDLAWVLATFPDERIRDATEAIRLAEAAARLTGRADGRVLDVLAAAHAAAGQFERAIAIVQEAIRMNPPASVLSDLLERRALYEMRRPYISSPRAR
jgi:tetratricopeptide (TPR) repeat protein